MAAAIACRNRRDTTLECLGRLRRQVGLADRYRLMVYLVDADSTDGTADAVKREFPDVSLLRVSDALYWNGAMRVAMDAAMGSEADFLLWLNDDVVLDEDAVLRALEVHAGVRRSGRHGPILVGSCIDPATGQASYGGWVRAGTRNPLNFRLVRPETACIPCDTMNGNFVLVPREVACLVGNLDAKFSHRIGDFDYGLRARALAVDLFVLPGTIGLCGRHDDAPEWLNRELGLVARLRKLVGPKGFPPLELAAYFRRHGGRYWLLHYVNTYLWAARRMARVGESGAK